MRETEQMTLNFGPQHPSTHGVLRLVVGLEGETVLSVKPVIGYLHTGIEKEYEDQRYLQGLTCSDRMDYLSPLSNNLAYCLSIEKICGIEPPKKGQYLRVLLVELQRIASHLIAIGTSVMDLGAMTVFLYCLREREAILDLKEMASGVRMMSTFIRPGGLRQDVPPEFWEGYEQDGKRVRGVKEFIADLPSRIDDYEALLTDNPIFLRRTQGVGVLTTDEALDYCCTGPILRATGMPYDVRKVKPYSSYEDFDFAVQTATEGDVFARYIVRINEMRESAKIVQQAIDKIEALGPDAPINADHRDYVPPPKAELAWSMESVIRHFKIWTEGILPSPGEAYVPIESARGEFGFYVVSDASAHPVRARVRPPSLIHLQCLDHLARGHMVADMIACLGSIDPVLGEIDR